MLPSIKQKIKRAFLSNQQFCTFLLVGALNTLFGYSLFAIFILLGCHYTLAVLLSTCAGVLFNFKTIGFIVFKSHDKRVLLNFLTVYAGLYGINIALIRLLHIGISNIYIAGGISTLLIALLSFYLNKHYVFNKTTGPIESPHSAN